MYAAIVSELTDLVTYSCAVYKSKSPVFKISVTILNDDDKNETCVVFPKDEDVYWAVAVTLILPAVFWVRVGNALTPIFNTFETTAKDELIELLSTFVAAVPATTAKSDTLIFEFVFKTIVGMESNPFSNMFIIVPNEELIDEVALELTKLPVIWTPSVILINPSADEVNKGIAGTPPSIIEDTKFQPSTTVSNSDGNWNDDVACEEVDTLNGFWTPQFKSIFLANAAGTDNVPFLIISWMIPNLWVILLLSDSVPLTEDVTLFNAETFVNDSIFLIIEGVSKIIFWTIYSERTFA